MLPPEGAKNILYNLVRAVEGVPIEVKEIDAAALLSEGWEMAQRLTPPRAPVSIGSDDDTPTIGINPLDSEG